MRALRKQLYDILEGQEHSTTANLVNGLIIGVVLLNVLVVMFETVESLALEYGDWFFSIEVVSVALFTIEYLVRLWVIVEDAHFAHPVKGRLRYMLTFRALVDLLAVVPSYVGAFGEFDARLLRLLRLVRMLKLTRYSQSMEMLVSVFRGEHVHISRPPPGLPGTQRPSSSLGGA